VKGGGRGGGELGLLDWAPQNVLRVHNKKIKVRWGGGKNISPTLRGVTQNLKNLIRGIPYHCTKQNERECSQKASEEKQEVFGQGIHWLEGAF